MEEEEEEEEVVEEEEEEKAEEERISLGMHCCMATCITKSPVTRQLFYTEEEDAYCCACTTHSLPGTLGLAVV